MLSKMRRTIKAAVNGGPLERIARRIDFHLTGNRNFLYDQQTAKIMKRVLRPNSSFVDVGCHKGEILKRALRYAPQGKHWAFEPLPYMYGELLKNFSGVNLFNLALSDKAGSVLFQDVRSNPGRSGMRRNDFVAGEVIEELIVNASTLDSIVTSSVHMIKIDVEGAELPVLRGAVETIRKNHPVIVFEHGLGGFEAYAYYPEDVFDFFSQVKMRLSTMARFLEDRPSLDRHQFLEIVNSGAEYYFIAY